MLTVLPALPFETWARVLHQLDSSSSQAMQADRDTTAVISAQRLNPLETTVAARTAQAVLMANSTAWT